MTKEELARKLMAEYEKDDEPISYEEALEVAEMEIKAGNIKRYEQSAEKKERKTSTRKADEDKQYLIQCLYGGMNVRTTETGGITDLVITNNEKTIDFNYNGNCYTINLVKHRPPKK